MDDIFSLTEVADMLSVSKETLRRWDNNGKLKAYRHPINNYRIYKKEQLKQFEELGFIFNNSPKHYERPIKNYTAVELFAGCGGLGIGLEQAGINCSLLNDNDKWCCQTLRKNRPQWNVIEGDIGEIDFSYYNKKADIVTGGFPCQAFSYAGNKKGFLDARGNLFYKYADAVKSIRPKIFLIENVKGLLKHDNGRTIETMLSFMRDLGYRVLEPKCLKALFYRVPQKRERTIIVGIRNDISIDFNYPEPHNKIYNLKDALKKSELYNSDVGYSEGTKYPKRKKEILEYVPQGGYWRDLPLKLQKEYMKKSYYLGGGKTGMARRMSWNEPSLTLTCSPAQKQTERCHPEETRPFTVREYARIQTFPDNWFFCGSISQQYKQIGNAVPVNMATELGYSLVEFLNEYYQSSINTIS